MYGTLISSQTVGAGGVASITFSAIPQTPFTDLIVVYSGTEIGVTITLNGNTSGQYNYRYLYGAGTFTSTSNSTGATGFNAAFTYYGISGELIQGQAHIANYAGSTNKSISVDAISETNTSNSMQQMFNGRLANTAAVTSITLTGLGTIPQYSTAYLYGLTKGDGGATVS